MENLHNLDNPKVLFFDINETLLDVSPLKTAINNYFKQDIFDLWFAKLLHYSLVSTVTGTFRSFGEIAIDALKAISTMKKDDIHKNISINLTDILSTLPVHSDVVESLEKLKGKGYAIVALSNSSESLLKNQLTNARIDHLFDKQISVEYFGKYKPHPLVYDGAVSLLSAKKEECMLVAAHDWDVFGALCSGLRAAFIERGRQSSYLFSIKPELEVADLLSLTEKL